MKEKIRQQTLWGSQEQLSAIQSARLNTNPLRQKEIDPLSKQEPLFITAENIQSVIPHRPNYLFFINAGGFFEGGAEMRFEETVKGISNSVVNNGHTDIHLGYIGPHLAIELPEAIADKTETPLSDSNLGKEQILKEAVSSLLESVDPNSTIAFICTADTGLAVTAIKRAFNRSNKPLQGIFIGAQSSFAVTNEPSDQNPQIRKMEDQIYRSQYDSNSQLTTHYIRSLIGALSPTEVSGDAPLATYCYSTSKPLTEARKEGMKLSSGNKSKKEAVAELLETNNQPDLAEVVRDPNFLCITLAVNKGLLDKSKIGTWWTQEQYNTSVTAIKNILLATSEVANALAKNSQKRIALFAPFGVIDFINEVQIPQKVTNIYDHRSLSHHPSDAGVHLMGFSPLSHNVYNGLLGASDLVVNRTYQANANLVTFMSEVPGLTVTMPDAGYMDAGETDTKIAKKFRLEHFRYDANVSAMADAMFEIFQNSNKRKEKLIAAQSSMLEESFQGTNNFFNVVSHILGIDCN